MFLGHRIKGGTICTVNEKGKAIEERDPPSKVYELRSFLGLVNYYRRFIQGFSGRAALLINLLKKNQPWHWTRECQEAFEDLKGAIMADLVRFGFNVQGPWLIAGYLKNGKICRRKSGGQKDPSKDF